MEEEARRWLRTAEDDGRMEEEARRWLRLAEDDGRMTGGWKRKPEDD